MNIYSGYAPKNDVKEFETNVDKAIKFIVDNGFTSVTLKHDGHDIEVSVINGNCHIDNVTGKYE